MSKPAGLFTVALRRLCDKTDFAITHGEARSLIAAQGIEIAPESVTLSDGAKTFLETYKAGKPWAKGSKWAVICANVAATMKMEPKSAGFKRIANEAANRLKFDNESNGFNVAKNLYKKQLNEGGETQTAKDAREGLVAPKVVAPKVKTTAMSKVAAASGARKVGSSVKAGPRPKHAPAVAVVGDLDAQIEAFKAIEAMGGYKAANKHMEHLKSQASDLRTQAEALDLQVDEVADQLQLAEKLQQRVAA